MLDQKSKPTGYFNEARTFLWRLLRTLTSRAVARRFALIAILLPMGVRTIPELLAGPWPLGFDTVWVYAPFVKDIQTEGLGQGFAQFFTYNHPAPLVYVLLGLGAIVTGAPPFAITKAAAPLLYGFLGLSLYYFGRRGLGWDPRKSLFLVLVTTLYFVPLRFSWDMYKNLLGYPFFLMALAHFRDPRHLRETAFLMTFAGLSILSSELTAVLLGAIAGALFLLEFARERRWNLPAIAVLGVAGLATLSYLGLLFPATVTPSPLAPAPARSLFLYSYVGAAEDVYVYPALGDVYATVLLLSGMVLGPLIPFAFAGFVRERRMMVWTAILAIGAFSVLVWPFAAIPAWHRWLFMLAFPALVFATRGVLKMDRRIRVAFLAALLVLAAAFIALPPSYAIPFYTNPRTIAYVQSSMLQNTVPIGDSFDVVLALEWLNNQQFSDSILLAHISFVGWAELYSKIPQIYAFADPAQVNGGNFSGYTHVFVVYWARNQGWYNPSSIPDGLTLANSVGRMAVYELTS